MIQLLPLDVSRFMFCFITSNPEMFAKMWIKFNVCKRIIILITLTVIFKEFSLSSFL